jgi:hypothetical protein
MLVMACVDVGVGRLRLLLEQSRRRHDLAGLAVAALRHIERQPCLLHRVVTGGGEAFDGDDLVGRLHVLDEDGAGALDLAVDVYGAGAALGDAAAVFGAGEPHLLAQGPKQGRIAVDLHIDGFAIHIQFGHGRPPR